MKRDLLRLLAGLVLATGLYSCSSPSMTPLGSGAAEFRKDSMKPTAESQRPGLATGWGKQKASSVSGQSFIRASSKPAGTDMIYYNDKDGIKAMTSSMNRVDGMQTAAGGLVEWGVKGRGGFLATYKEGGYGRRLVAGDAGSNYSIAIRNCSRSTLEIVASVDGLDVFDGKSASFVKRGYLVEPG